MKTNLLLISLAISISCFSQQRDWPDTAKWKDNMQIELWHKGKIDSLHPSLLNLSPSFRQAQLSLISDNGDKIYTLPLDNMQCLVPNPLLYNDRMPVAKGKMYGNIPNGSPQLIIPKDN